MDGLEITLRQGSGADAEHVVFYPELNVPKNLTIRDSTFLNPRPSPPKPANRDWPPIAVLMKGPEIHPPMVLTGPLNINEEREPIDSDVSAGSLCYGFKWPALNPSSLVKRFFDINGIQKNADEENDQAEMHDTDAIEMVDLAPAAIVRQLSIKDCSHNLLNRHKPRNSQIHDPVIQTRPNQHFYPVTEPRPVNEDRDNSGLVEYHNFQFSLRKPLSHASESPGLNAPVQSESSSSTINSRHGLSEDLIKRTPPSPSKIPIFQNGFSNPFKRAPFYAPSHAPESCLHSCTSCPTLPYTESSAAGSSRGGNAIRWNKEGNVADSSFSHACPHALDLEPETSISNSKQAGRSYHAIHQITAIEDEIEAIHKAELESMGFNRVGRLTLMPRGRVGMKDNSMDNVINDYVFSHNEISSKRSVYRSTRIPANEVEGLLSHGELPTEDTFDRYKLCTPLMQDSSTTESEYRGPKIPLSGVIPTCRETAPHSEKSFSKPKAQAGDIISNDKGNIFGDAFFPSQPEFAYLRNYTTAEVLLVIGYKHRYLVSNDPIPTASNRHSRSSSWRESVSSLKAPEPTRRRRYTASGLHQL